MSRLRELTNAHRISLLVDVQFGQGHLSETMQRIGELPRLAGLELASNAGTRGPSLGTEDIEILSKLTKLEMLSFAGVGVSIGPWLDALVELRSFTKLPCAYCGPTSDEDVARIAALPKLQTVNLNHEQDITDAGAQALSRAPNLREVYLRGRFSPAAVAYFESRGRPFALTLHSYLPEYEREVRARALRLSDDPHGAARGLRTIVLATAEGIPSVEISFVADAAVYQGNLHGEPPHAIDRAKIHDLLDLIDDMASTATHEGSSPNFCVNA